MITEEESKAGTHTWSLLAREIDDRLSRSQALRYNAMAGGESRKGGSTMKKTSKEERLIHRPHLLREAGPRGKKGSYLRTHARH